jgi:hypothetical protein
MTTVSSDTKERKRKMDNLRNVEVKAGQYRDTEMITLTVNKPKSRSFPKRVMKEVLPYLKAINENWDAFFSKQIICEVQKNAIEKVRLYILQPAETKYLKICVVVEDVDHEWKHEKRSILLQKEELDQALTQLEALLS